MKIFQPYCQKGRLEDITINKFIKRTGIIEPLFKLKKPLIKSCVTVDASQKGNYTLFILGTSYDPEINNFHNNQHLTQIQIIKYQLMSVHISQPMMCIGGKEFRLINNTTIKNKWYGLFCNVESNNETTLYYGTRQLLPDEYDYIANSEFKIHGWYDLYKPGGFHIEMISEYLLIRTNVNEIAIYRFNHLKGSIKKLNNVKINNDIEPRFKEPNFYFSMFIISGGILIQDIGQSEYPMELDLYSIADDSFTKAFVNINQAFVFPTTKKQLKRWEIKTDRWKLYQTMYSDKIQEELLIFGYITVHMSNLTSIPYSIKKIICSYYSKDKIAFIYYNFDRSIFECPLHLWCWSFDVDKLYIA